MSSLLSHFMESSCTWHNPQDIYHILSYSNLDSYCLISYRLYSWGHGIFFFSLIFHQSSKQSGWHINAWWVLSAWESWKATLSLSRQVSGVWEQFSAFFQSVWQPWVVWWVIDEIFQVVQDRLVCFVLFFSFSLDYGPGILFFSSLFPLCHFINSDRPYFIGLPNHCRWWLQPWN